MKITTAEDVVLAIDDGYDNDRREKAREYIGASIIGHACDAAIAFNLRGFPNVEPDPRLKRIFGLGHIIEDLVVADLKKRADARVWEVDGLTGRQFAHQAWGGHISCHLDGHIELDDGVVRVLEIKSMNDASFNKFKKVGVKRSHPQYYSQVQMMMGMSDITSSLFIAMNKNNSSYHAEIVEYDEFEFAHIKERIERVILGEVARVAPDKSDWRCRGCFKREVCWDEVEVEAKCARCKHSVAHPDGYWHCKVHDTEAKAVCDEYEIYRPLAKE